MLSDGAAKEMTWIPGQITEGILILTSSQLPPSETWIFPPDGSRDFCVGSLPPTTKTVYKKVSVRKPDLELESVPFLEFAKLERENKPATTIEREPQSKTPAAEVTQSSLSPADYPLGTPSSNVDNESVKASPPFLDEYDSNTKAGSALWSHQLTEVVGKHQPNAERVPPASPSFPSEHLDEFSLPESTNSSARKELDFYGIEMDTTPKLSTRGKDRSTKKRKDPAGGGRRGQ
jgi:hypothetical protein